MEPDDKLELLYGKSWIKVTYVGPAGFGHPKDTHFVRDASGLERAAPATRLRVDVSPDPVPEDNVSTKHEPEVAPDFVVTEEPSEPE